MKSRDFVYWLQGFIELNADGLEQQNTLPNARQWETIKRHLSLVFKHEIDPEGGDSILQEALNNLHKRPSPPFNPEIPAAHTADPNILIRC